MDVTPQLIEQIDFSEKFRGYDPDQVDDFLERVGATIAELNNAVREANLRADRAEQAARDAEHAAREAAAAAPPAPVAPAAMSDEEAATTAARTLMLAQRTADDLTASAQAEAEQMRAQAQQTLDAATLSARAEGERLLAEARAAADGLVAQARQDAERELADRRAAVVDEVSVLEARRADLVADLTAIESRIDSYRDSLDRVHGAIRTVLDDPDGLRVHPPLDLVAGATTSAVPIVEARAEDAAPFEPAPFEPASFENVESEPVRVDEPVLGGTDEAATPGASFHEDPSASAFSAAPPAEMAGESESPFLAAPVADGPTPVVDWTDTGDAWRPETTASEPAVGEPTGSAPSADPWGPGSWSAVVGGDASGATTRIWEDPTRAGTTGALPVTEYVPLTGEAPVSEPFGVAAQDRFLRDLDEAVNQTEAVGSDDAMTAFFEGDDEPQSSRRFRRR